MRVPPHNDSSSQAGDFSMLNESGSQRCLPVAALAVAPGWSCADLGAVFSDPRIEREDIERVQLHLVIARARLPRQTAQSGRARDQTVLL